MPRTRVLTNWRTERRNALTATSESKTLTPDCANAREQQHTSSINAVVNLEQGVVNRRVEMSEAENRAVRQVFAFR